MTTPTLVELAVRLAAAGPQWRPEADLVAAELTAYMRQLYPKCPRRRRRELRRRDGPPGPATWLPTARGERAATMSSTKPVDADALPGTGMADRATRPDRGGDDRARETKNDTRTMGGRTGSARGRRSRPRSRAGAEVVATGKGPSQ